MENIIAGILVGSYSFAKYYIYWLTDTRIIKIISEINDEIIWRYQRPLTYIKCIQLYDAIKTVNASSVDVGRGVLGGPTITILVENNPAVIFSVCFCCHELGIIKDIR
jgi:hypothetical protein